MMRIGRRNAATGAAAKNIPLHSLERTSRQITSASYTVSPTSTCASLTLPEAAPAYGLPILRFMAVEVPNSTYFADKLIATF